MEQQVFKFISHNDKKNGYSSKAWNRKIKEDLYLKDLKISII